MSAPAVTFVIPIRHPDGVADRDEQRRTLAQTVASVCAQRGRSWRLRIACNRGQTLPPLPRGVEVVELDLPSNAEALSRAETREAMLDVFKRDKARRVLAALGDLGPRDRFMIVDDDDLVSCRLARFFERADPAQAFHVDAGWSWIEGHPALRRLDDFHRCCGTSLAAPWGHWRAFQAPQDDAALCELGCHWTLFDRLAGTAQAFRALPFRAAVYRLGHANSMEGLMARFGESRAFMRRRIVPGGRRLTRLRRRLDHYSQFRPIFPLLRREFFGAGALRRGAA
ncbi:MAG: hypothetical protein AAF192_10060 [Pseudomonadota bacterium]